QLIIRGIADDTLFGTLDAILNDRPSVDELATYAWARAADSPKINCMALPDIIIDTWKSFFHARKFRLQGITPRQLSCAPLIDPDKIKNNNFLLIESTPDKWFVTMWKSGKIDHFKTYIGNAWEAPLTMLQDIAMDGITLICMSETPLTCSNLRRQLAEKINYHEAEEFIPTSHSRNRWSLEGFASSLNKDNDFSCPFISTAEKRPPVHKRPALWMTTTAILWSLFLVNYYKTKRLEVNHLQMRLEKKQHANQALQEQINLASINAQEAEAYKHKIASIDNEKRRLLRRNTKSVALIDNNFIIDFIKTISSNNHEQVTIDSLSASNDGSFTIEGKSYSSVVLQKLPHQLAVSLEAYLQEPCIMNIENKNGSFSFSLRSTGGINEKK
ncbi:MAG: hypothetical protein HRT88_19290, partial [Lentisphaeraceae bacterium]|nr:hypothetical protein [Lentisphaeraceae bacterium]